jgi:uncharacterized membrane protein YciS (DUF1049 family)
LSHIYLFSISACFFTIHSNSKLPLRFVLDGTENGLSSRNPFLTIYYPSAPVFSQNTTIVNYHFILCWMEQKMAYRVETLFSQSIIYQRFFLTNHSHSQLPLRLVLDGTENDLSSRNPFLTYLYYPSAPVFSQNTAIVNYHFVLCWMEQKIAYRVETLFSQSIIYQRLFFSQNTAIVNYHFVLCWMEQKMAYRVETLFSQSIIYQRLFFHKTQP